MRPRRVGQRSATHQCDGVCEGGLRCADPPYNVLRGTHSRGNIIHLWDKCCGSLWFRPIQAHGLANAPNQCLQHDLRQPTS
jgi:hypothetical protein